VTEDLEARVTALEEQLERQHAAHEAYKEQVVKPRLEELATARDDARSERAELEDAVATLRDRVRDLEVALDSVIGLADEETGGPAKRCADLRLGLIRAAEANPDGTTAGKHWEDVHDFFAEHGHGDVSKPECYQAMADVTEHDGFWTDEKALVLPSGREGRGVFVDTDALPNHVSVGESSGATTRYHEEVTTTAADD
jgi:hypothetical protein